MCNIFVAILQQHTEPIGICFDELDCPMSHLICFNINKASLYFGLFMLNTLVASH